jgi:hypothetical protein
VRVGYRGGGGHARVDLLRGGEGGVGVGAVAVEWGSIHCAVVKGAAGSRSAAERAERAERAEGAVGGKGSRDQSLRRERGIHLLLSTERERGNFRLVLSIRA